MAPLPLHGQVRPIKVEHDHDWGHQQAANDENHPSNLSSTPPILRRRNRKRDAEEEKLDQVTIQLSALAINFNKIQRKDWRTLGTEIQNKCLNSLPFTPSKVRNRTRNLALDCTTMQHPIKRLQSFVTAPIASPEM